MKLSRSNLAVVGVAATAQGDPLMAQVHIEDDGTTVASDGKVVMAVEGVSRVPPALPAFDGEVDVPSGGLGVEVSLIKEAVRRLPKGALGIELGYAVITKVDVAASGRAVGVELASTDLVQVSKVSGKVVRQRFPEWRQVFRGTEVHVAGGQEGVRVCVNRKSLVKLLQAMDEACPDSDDAVFLEVPQDGDGVMLRAVSMVTGQRALGYISCVKTGGAWLPPSKWERKILGRGAKRLKKVAGD